MSLHIPCPHCDKVVNVPDDYLGGSVRCPYCAVVFAVQKTGVTADVPPGAPAPWRNFTDAVTLERPPLPRSRRYEPGRVRQLLTLGLSSIAVSIAGMASFAIYPALPVLFGPPAFALGLAAWVKGQRDVEKVQRALIDPNAGRLTRAGWAAGTVGAILGVLVMLCGLGGLYLAFVFSGAADLQNATR
jgi:hypothetical protein